MSEGDSDSSEIVNICRQPPPPPPLPAAECKIGQFLTELYLVLNTTQFSLSPRNIKNEETRGGWRPSQGREGESSVELKKNSFSPRPGSEREGERGGAGRGSRNKPRVPHTLLTLLPPASWLSSHLLMFVLQRFPGPRLAFYLISTAEMKYAELRSGG